MAQRYITEITDDLTGGTATQTITFAIDGTNYTIDLNDDNAENLRDVLAPYITAARKGSTDTKPRTKPAKQDLTAIRTWAKTNGYTIADRGRIAHDIVDAYNAAN